MTEDQSGSDGQADGATPAQSNAARKTALPDLEPGPAGVVGRGFAMGIAELIPGVSGGTIALITGIYPKFIKALASLSPMILRDLPRDGLAQTWSRYHLGFLTLLAVGMGLAILSLSRLLHHALAVAPMLVWGFFFGLIAGSVLLLGRAVAPRRWWLLALGAVLGFAFVQLPGLAGSDSLWVLLLAGALAISAWMLPSVSGSFVLVLLGLYDRIIAAIAELDLLPLSVFAVGCGLGLLLFARVVQWLLGRFEAPVMALLVGLMLGSLPRLWPWQSDAGELLSPASFETLYGVAPWAAGSAFAALVGCICVLALGRLGSASLAARG